MDKQNNLRIIQKISEHHTRKAQNPRNTVNSHLGHCTDTSVSSNGNMQNIQRVK
jgi:hypothetical protein